MTSAGMDQYFSAFWWKFLDEITNQGGNVLAAFTQGGKSDGEDVDAIKQIGTKLLLRDHGPQVAVGSRDQPEIGVDGARSAEALELAVLQHAEKLGLHFERQLADFV